MVRPRGLPRRLAGVRGTVPPDRTRSGPPTLSGLAGGNSLTIVTVVGSLAAVCSTASFAPQVWKIIKTRDTSAISRRMYVLTVIGFSLWLAYGILRREWPLIVPNAICLLMSAFILAMKIMPRERAEALARSLHPGPTAESAASPPG